ncbi:hypothetical protein AVEN_164166-1 [Araneus ventricosus]|uniref:Uncharacterized protein n=1 Tax=Araneus ventricosus TaxID=182803 RepID=A0A4Y2I5B5_ARAVE|nr:hypothetical protein AVEN_238643-1 [Araneus ventricosus]GBM72895.1 hypothetical protein AVEN_164166-1 [Araneus ventricosus]
MLVLWVEREFYRDSYWMPANDPRTWRQNEGTRKCKNYGPIYIMNRYIEIFLENYMSSHALSESCKYPEVLKRGNLFGVLFAVRVGQLLDAERY